MGVVTIGLDVEEAEVVGFVVGLTENKSSVSPNKSLLLFSYSIYLRTDYDSKASFFRINCNINQTVISYSSSVLTGYTHGVNSVVHLRANTSLTLVAVMYAAVLMSI